MQCLIRSWNFEMYNKKRKQTTSLSNEVLRSRCHHGSRLGYQYQEPPWLVLSSKQSERQLLHLALGRINEAYLCFHCKQKQRPESAHPCLLVELSLSYIKMGRHIIPCWRDFTNLEWCRRVLEYSLLSHIVEKDQWRIWRRQLLSLWQQWCHPKRHLPRINRQLLVHVCLVSYCWKAGSSGENVRER